LSSGFDEPAPTPQCHLDWWTLCCSTHKYVAIAAPRAHAKSTAITKCYTLASVLFREHDYVLIISDTYAQACLFLGEIKREIVQNETLRELFEVQELLMDRENDIIVLFKDGKMFRITALGSEMKVRGLLWNNKRPNLIIGDDLENDEIVLNQERREKFRNWFNNALLPCLSERGKARVVGTILHLDSFLERRMPEDRSANTVTEELRTYMKRPTKGWMSVRYAGHGPDATFDSILWPVKWTAERFKEIQARYVADGNPEGYYQEYLNRPIDPAHAFFKKEDFVPMSEDNYKLPMHLYPTYLACDLAVTTQTKRDFSVFGIATTDEKGLLYVRHVIRERMDSKEIVDTIINLHSIYSFSTLLIGKGTLEKSIGPFLRDVQNQLPDKFFHMEAIPEVVDKRQRAQSIRARMRAGGVRIDKKGLWYPELEAELLQFDRGAHDDQVDMMSLYGMFLNKLHTAPSSKEIEEEMWEMENKDNVSQLLNQGRSLSGGY
jgi:predicted phage terminase large subunit-like protein